MNPTKQQILAMNTKELQALYLRVNGKATSNRNATALRARLIAKLGATDTAPPAKATTAKRDRTERTPEQVGVGRVLVHKFRGGKKPVQCTVVAEGFKFGRKVYPSLGAAALAASKVTWNGSLFWGLAPFPKHRPKSAA